MPLSSNTAYILIGLVGLFFLSSCQGGRRDVSFLVKNDEATEVYDIQFLYAVTAFGEKNNGSKVLLQTYRITKGGFMETLEYHKVKQSSERWVEYGGIFLIETSSEYKNYLFIIRSLRENGNAHVLIVRPEIANRLDQDNPLIIPALSTLPPLSADQFADLRLQYETLNKLPFLNPLME